MENKLVNNLKAGLTNHKGKVIAVSVLVLILVGVIVSRNLHAAPKSTNPHRVLLLLMLLSYSPVK